MNIPAMLCGFVMLYNLIMSGVVVAQVKNMPTLEERENLLKESKECSSAGGGWFVAMCLCLFLGWIF